MSIDYSGKTKYKLTPEIKRMLLEANKYLQKTGCNSVKAIHQATPKGPYGKAEAIYYFQQRIRGFQTIKGWEDSLGEGELRIRWQAFADKLKSRL